MWNTNVLQDWRVPKKSCAARTIPFTKMDSTSDAAAAGDGTKSLSMGFPKMVDPTKQGLLYAFIWFYGFQY